MDPQASLNSKGDVLPKQPFGLYFVLYAAGSSYIASAFHQRNGLIPQDLSTQFHPRCLKETPLQVRRLRRKERRAV